MKYTERERELLNSWPTVTEQDLERMNDLFSHYLFFRRAYREKHGLGCWKRLARGKVTEELLRGVLADARLLTRREWRAIGRALDRAERQEGANGKSN